MNAQIENDRKWIDIYFLEMYNMQGVRCEYKFRMCVRLCVITRGLS